MVDIYCDMVQVSISPFDVLLCLSQRAIVPNAPNLAAAPRQVGCVRMSLEHAKALSIMLRKGLKCYEDSVGQPIPLHPEVRSGIGISLEEDW